MTACNRYVNCAVWVEATKCVANTSGLRVFVHEDNLPGAASWFAFDSQGIQINCWSIDPADPKVCLPSGDGIYAYEGPFPWAACTACEATDEDDGEGLPGGVPGDGGGGGGGGAGGGDGGWPFDGITPKGIKVTVCADHVARATARGWNVDNLYIATDTLPGQSRIYDIQGICLTIPNGPIVTSPDPAFWIGWTGDGYGTCSDCTHGVQATLCAADALLPGAGDAPEIWVRAEDIDAAGDGFEYAGWCYEVNATPLAVIPADAIRWAPTEDIACGACNQGVQYTLCPGESDPGVEYWADAKDIAALLIDYPLLTSIIQKIDGYCHSLDLTATTSRMPTDARQVPPKCQFNTCDDCLCGGTPDASCTGQTGIPLRLCPGENAAGWRDTWMPASALPAGLTHFNYRGYCVSINPFEPASEIPATAEVLYIITNKFNNCWDCTGWRPPDQPGGGGPGPSNPSPLPPPPGPPKTCWFRLWECDVGFSDKWVLLPCDTKIGAGKHDGKCYAVRHPGKNDLPVGAQIVGLDEPRQQNLLAGELACSLLGRYECGPLYYLRMCPANDFPNDVWKNTRTDLAADVGKVISANGGVCYKVFEGDVIGIDIGPVVVEERFDDCEECEAPACVPAASPSANCDDVTPAEYDITFSSVFLCACYNLNPGVNSDKGFEYINGFILNTVHRVAKTSPNAWELSYVTPAPVREKSYPTTDGTCGGTSSNADWRIIISLEKLTTTWRLRAVVLAPGGFHVAELFHDIQTAFTSGADQVCATVPAFTNDLTTCGDQEIPGEFWNTGATGGSATVVCVEA